MTEVVSGTHAVIISNLALLVVSERVKRLYSYFMHAQCHLSSAPDSKYIYIIKNYSKFFQAPDITHPKKGKWLSSPSHLSSFSTVYLLFKRRFVV